MIRSATYVDLSFIYEQTLNGALDGNLDAASELASMIKNENGPITHLNLSGYDITDTNQHAFSTIFANTSLLGLNLACTKLKDSTVDTIGQALPKTLTELDLSGNPGLTETGFASLLRSLEEKCPALEYLRLANCNLSQNQWMQLYAWMRRSQRPITLDVSGKQDFVLNQSLFMPQDITLIGLTLRSPAITTALQNTMQPPQASNDDSVSPPSGRFHKLNKKRIR